MSEQQDETVVCLPGERLCRTVDSIVLGIGTYEQNGYIYASKSGIVNIEDSGDKVSNPGISLTLGTN